MLVFCFVLFLILISYENRDYIDYFPLLVIIAKLTGQFQPNSREEKGLDDVKFSICFMKWLDS